jgi:hypothetical protein
MPDVHRTNMLACRCGATSDALLLYIQAGTTRMTMAGLLPMTRLKYLVEGRPALCGLQSLLCSRLMVWNAAMSAGLFVGLGMALLDVGF